MIVICDTSPVNYLVWIGKIEILKELFGGVVIPNAVLAELLDERTPEMVRRWVQALPD